MAIKSMGTTLYFTPSGGSKTRIGKLSAIGEIAPDSEVIDITTLDSQGGYREYMQGARDAGSVELRGYYAPGDAGQAALQAAYSTGKAGSASITFPDGTTFQFSAFVRSYRAGAAEVDGAVAFGAVLRITGGISMTNT